MKHYAIYDRATGALICVGKTIPDPLPETQAAKVCDGPTPHVSFWDPQAHDFLVPLDLPAQVQGLLQSLTDPARLGLFARKLVRTNPALDAERVRAAVVRAYHGRITMDDYALLCALPQLQLEACKD